MESRVDMEERFRSVAGFLLPAYAWDPGFPLLVCLYSGSRLPRFVEPMPREPEVEVGGVLDATFALTYREALRRNPELHDGAVLARRDGPAGDAYSVSGWSYRLFPPALGTLASANRGSAFHSCRAMSALQEVDAMILFARSERSIFIDGELWHNERLG